MLVNNISFKNGFVSLMTLAALMGTSEIALGMFPSERPEPERKASPKLQNSREAQTELSLEDSGSTNQATSLLPPHLDVLLSGNLANGLNGEVDGELNANFIRLHALLPEQNRDNASLKAIYELSDQFGHNFWNDSIQSWGKTIITLIEMCDAPDRPELMHVLNDIFRPLTGNEIDKRKLRAHFVHDFHRLYKQDMVQKLRTMTPLILRVVEDCKDHNILWNLINRLSDLGRNLPHEKFKPFVSNTLHLLESVKIEKGHTKIFISMQRALEIDPTGVQLPGIIGLILPFFDENKILDKYCEGGFEAETIPVLLQAPDEERENIVRHSLPFKDFSRLSSIMEQIAATPESDRENLVGRVQLLQDRIALSGYAVDQIFSSFAKFSVVQRETVSNRLLQISSQKKIPDYIYFELLPTLSTISDADWEGILQPALTLIDDLGVSEAISEVAKIPEHVRADVIAKYFSLVEKRSRATEIQLKKSSSDKLFSVIADIPSEEWEDILEHAIPFSACTECPGDVASIIATIRPIPVEKRAEVCRSLEPLKTLLKDLSIFNLAIGLTPDELKQLPGLINAISADIPFNNSHLTDLLYDTRKLSARNRFAKLQFAAPYLEDFKYPSARRCFLVGVSAIPEADLHRVIGQSYPILKRIVKNHVDLTYRLAEIPAEELPDVIQALDMLSQDLKDGMYFGSVLDLITQFPATERSALIELLKAYLPYIKNFDSRIQLTRVLRSIAPEQREELLRSYFHGYMNRAYGQGAVLASIAKIPENERTICLQKANELLPKEYDGFLYADVLNTIYSMNLFAQDEHHVLDRYISFLKNIRYEGSMYVSLDFNEPEQIPTDVIGRHKLRRNFMTVLEPLPYHFLESSIDALTTLEARDPIQFKSLFISPVALVNFLRSQEAINISNLEEYWGEFLQTSPDKVRVKILADFITTHYHWFGLLEDDGIVQRSIRSGILLENSTDPLNPYRIFEKLQEKRAEEINWADITLATEVFDGISVRFNPEFLRDDLPQYGLTFAQLPPHSETFLEDCITAMDKRVLDNPPLEQEIRKITTSGYAKLKNDSLADRTLHRLLTDGGKPNDRVKVIKGRFIAIIAYLETLSGLCLDGETFSPREEGFLRMLASIQGCPNGKSEGINSYYLNVLPVEWRYSSKVAQGDDDVAYLRSKAEVTAILLEEVEKMFSGQNHLMKSLVGIQHTDAVGQASHQAGYLRNLIGRTVGLSDQLLFDAHTQTLYTNLVNTSKQEALQAFFKFFTPHSFIHRISVKYSMDEAETIGLLAEMGILFTNKTE